MSDFEREVAHCINAFLDAHHIRGFAYRLKQSKFNTQYVDLLVDSLDPRYYLAIECKSIRGKKLYFSQHFHEDRNNIHQIDAITEFLEKTGRKGILAVEFRAGPGRPKEAYFLPWERVRQMYERQPGITIEEFRDGVPLSRCSDRYVLDHLYPKDFHAPSPISGEL